MGCLLGEEVEGMMAKADMDVDNLTGVAHDVIADIFGPIYVCYREEITNFLSLRK